MVAIGLTAVVAAPASATDTDQPLTAAAQALVPACVDFLPLADNTVLGTVFTRDGYDFRAPAGGLVPFVNETVDLLGTLVHGAQFDNAGLRVTLPAPADAVEVSIGVFATPGVQIRAVDAAGVIVDSAFVAADNILHTVTLDGVQDINRLRFTGGGNEGTIQEICSA
jgi:hypothetical protein